MARRGPTKRLLLTPLALLVGLIVVLQLVQAANPRRMDPGLAVVGAPESAAEAQARTCVRDDDRQAVADVRAALEDQPVVTSGWSRPVPRRSTGSGSATWGKRWGSCWSATGVHGAS